MRPLRQPNPVSSMMTIIKWMMQATSVPIKRAPEYARVCVLVVQKSKKTKAVRGAATDRRWRAHKRRLIEFPNRLQVIWKWYCCQRAHSIEILRSIVYD